MHIKKAKIPNNYCIYTDNTYHYSQITPDHPIARSLGGPRPLTVPSYTVFNSAMGKYEGIVANDPVTAVYRNQHNVRGASGKIRSGVWSNGTSPEKFGKRIPTRVTARFSGNEVDLYDGITKLNIQNNTAFMFNLDIPILERRLVTIKSLIGLSWYIYGERSKEFLHYNLLRNLLGVPETHASTELVQRFGWADPLAPQQTKLEQLVSDHAERYCKASKTSILVSGNHEYMIWTLCIIGRYFASIRVPIREQLPEELRGTQLVLQKGDVSILVEKIDDSSLASYI